MNTAMVVAFMNALAQLSGSNSLTGDGRELPSQLNSSVEFSTEKGSDENTWNLKWIRDREDSTIVQENRVLRVENDVVYWDAYSLNDAVTIDETSQGVLSFHYNYKTFDHPGVDYQVEITFRKTMQNRVTFSRNWTGNLVNLSSDSFAVWPHLLY